MTHTASVVWLLALIVLTHAYQTTVCPQNPVRDQIQTGIIQFQNTYLRQSCKDVDVTFSTSNSQLQIAASVVSTENYSITNGVDYAVKVGYQKGNNKFTATLLADHAANWTKITVSYIATSRTDLLMGSFLTDTFQTLKCLQNPSSTQVNTIQVSSVIGAWTSSFLNAKAIVFISGIQTISTNINSIKVVTAEVNSSGILNVKIQSSQGLELEFIQLSYILVSSSFPFQHGYELNHPEYSFQVFEEFKNNKLVQARWGIYTGSLICEGIACAKKCLSKDQCQSFNGNSFNGHCYICDKGKVFDGQACISICGNNQFWNGSQCVCESKAFRVKSNCVTCQANSTPNKQQTECICNQGFIFNSWKSLCVSFSCPVNSQPKVNQNDVECVCKSGFYKAGDVCRLIPECPTNSVFDILKVRCVCTIEGQFMNNGICISCGKNQIWDQVTKKCQCRPNFIAVGNSCVACPAFSTLNSEKTKCICNQGYIWNDWKVACIAFKCPANTTPLCTETGVKCNCRDGWFLNNDVCQIITKCPTGAKFDINRKSCVCQRSNTYLIRGECSQCPINTSWKDNQCACSSGFIQLGGFCIFVCGKNQVLEAGKCVCNSKSISINRACQQCPVNSIPNKQKTLCFCSQGFKWDQTSKTCVKFTCPQNSVAQLINDTTTTCVCGQGFVMQNNICVRVGRCPVNSVWKQNMLCCVCSNTGQYLINNECRKCGANQEWNNNDKKCVCANGFDWIEGECRVCEIGQSFNGSRCECNLGSFRNPSKRCQPCHTSCGTCTGSGNTNCLTCSDVTFNFRNGSCAKDTACPKGLYQKGSSCSPCSTYCTDCKSESSCTTCIDGFQMESVSYGGVSASYCVQKCGDGRRFQLDCDDGNNQNGDGCTADCKVEAGWTCANGSSIRASVCTRGTPQRSLLELTGTVHLYGRIVQGVRLSHIPQALTANDCAECYNLLWVRVIRSDIVPGVRVNYLPKSKYQFLVQFEFHGTFSIPTFNIAVQINPEYAKYFNRRDMSQIQIKTVDPAVLAMKDEQLQLELDQISDVKAPIQISNTLVRQLFK